MPILHPSLTFHWNTFIIFWHNCPDFWTKKCIDFFFYGKVGWWTEVSHSLRVLGLMYQCYQNVWFIKKTTKHGVLANIGTHQINFTKYDKIWQNMIKFTWFVELPPDYVFNELFLMNCFSVFGREIFIPSIWRLGSKKPQLWKHFNTLLCAHDCINTNGMHHQVLEAGLQNGACIGLDREQKKRTQDRQEEMSGRTTKRSKIDEWLWLQKCFKMSS